MGEKEYKMQHLEFIQNIITRMNTNSFQIKGVTVAIITACLALYASDKTVLMIFVPIIPTFILWFLDSYYLLQERKFRALYDDVANIKNPPLCNPKPYEMPIHKYTADKKDSLSFWRVFFSQTIAIFYLPLILMLLLLFIALNIKRIFVIL